MKFYSRETYIKTRPNDKWEAKCPFCDIENEKEYIIYKWKFFYVKHNIFPYLWDQDHLLVIPYRHVVFTKDLTKEEYSELPEIENFLFNFYKDKKYFSFIREHWKFKSLNHLHYHYLPWEVDDIFIEKMLENQWFKRNILD